MSKAQIADALRRAVRTFIQAAGAYLAVAPDHASARALALGAVAAGGAAVWRLTEKPVEVTPEPEPEPEPVSTPVRAASSRRKAAITSSTTPGTTDAHL